MGDRSTEIARRAAALLEEAGDPERAHAMAAYMRTDMPFYGVGSPERKRIARALIVEFEARTRKEYTASVRALWRGNHREEKYLAVTYARSFPRYITLSSVPLYRMMITQGAWWDLVDEPAAHLVGAVLLNQRGRFTPTIDAWSTGPDMWLRRSSILSQLRHKQDTDTDLLARVCLRNLSDTEFFIRKAIGWSLREYAKTDPVWVSGFLDEHGAAMSGLTRREAGKHLPR